MVDPYFNLCDTFPEEAHLVYVTCSQMIRGEQLTISWFSKGVSIREIQRLDNFCASNLSRILFTTGPIFIVPSLVSCRVVMRRY